MTDNELLMLGLGFEIGCYLMLAAYFAFQFLDERRDRRRLEAARKRAET